MALIGGKVPWGMKVADNLSWNGALMMRLDEDDRSLGMVMTWPSAIWKVTSYSYSDEVESSV